MDAVIISEPGKGGTTVSCPKGSPWTEGRRAYRLSSITWNTTRRVVPPVAGEGECSWWSSPKLNGIYLFSYLTRNGFDVALVNQYFRERARFRDLLKENLSAVIISTTFIRNRKTLEELTADIRLLAPDVPIIAGGSFVYLSYLAFQRSQERDYLPQDARDDLLFFNADDPAVDLYIISLVGEPILIESLKKMRKGSSLDTLPGVDESSILRYASPACCPS